MLSYEELCEKIAEALEKYLACGGRDPAIYMNEETFRILKEGSQRHTCSNGGSETVCGMAIRIRDDLPEATTFAIGTEPLGRYMSCGNCSQPNPFACAECENKEEWVKIPCPKCGGILSEIREHNGKQFRHCYACHMEIEA